MARYIMRTTAREDDFAKEASRFVDTGLVDTGGFIIWRLPDPEPERRVGFQW